MIGLVSKLGIPLFADYVEIWTQEVEPPKLSINGEEIVSKKTRAHFVVEGNSTEHPAASIAVGDIVSANNKIMQLVSFEIKQSSEEERSNWKYEFKEVFDDF